MLDHTIVIPTYNRPGELRALLQYYHAKGDQTAIIVADSSANPESRAENRKTAGAFSNVRYFDYDPAIQVPDKILRSLRLVETGFVSLCADDDIVFLSGIEQAISELRGNPNFVCAHGIYFNFRRNPKKTGTLEVHVEYQLMNTASASAGARLMQISQHYEPVFYAVFRTADLVRIFEPCLWIPTLHFQELFQTFAAALLGNAYRFSQAYGGRHSGPAAQPERTNWQTYDYFCGAPEGFLGNYLSYRDLLIAFYNTNVPQQPLERPQLELLFNMSHSTFFTRHATSQHFFRVASFAYPGEVFQDWTDKGLLSQIAASEIEKAAPPTTLAESLAARVRARLEAFLKARQLESVSGNATAKIVSSSKSIDRVQLSDVMKAAIGAPTIEAGVAELALYCDIRDPAGNRK